MRDKFVIVYAKVSKEDATKVLPHRWSVSHGYARTTIDNKTVSMHRLILGLPDEKVDHINHDRLDNRKANLRLCNSSQNNQNSIHIKGVNEYRGVYQRSEKSFRAVLHANGTSHRIGGLRTAHEAAIAYNNLAREHHGVFAVLNEIPETEAIS